VCWHAWTGKVRRCFGQLGEEHGRGQSRQVLQPRDPISEASTPVREGPSERVVLPVDLETATFRDGAEGVHQPGLPTVIKDGECGPLTKVEQVHRAQARLLEELLEGLLLR
jgi:hypothetical protein